MLSHVLFDLDNGALALADSAVQSMHVVPSPSVNSASSCAKWTSFFQEQVPHTDAYALTLSSGSGIQTK